MVQICKTTPDSKAQTLWIRYYFVNINKCCYVTQGSRNKVFTGFNLSLKEKERFEQMSLDKGKHYKKKIPIETY